MAIKLKDLGKSLNDVLRKLEVSPGSGQLAKAIGEALHKDIIKAMDIGKEPDGTRLKKVTAFTKRTKEEYKRLGVRTKPRFEKTGDLKRAIRPTTKKGFVKVSVTGSQNNKKKIEYLLSEKTKSGSKASRIVFGLTNTRRKIVRDLINKFIRQTFK